MWSFGRNIIHHSYRGIDCLQVSCVSIFILSLRRVFNLNKYRRILFESANGTAPGDLSVKENFL